MKFKSFPADDRVWRLNWFGGVDRGTYERSLSEIKLSFSPLVTNLKLKRYSNHAVDSEVNDSVSVAIGHLPSLTLGSAWKNGEAIINDNINSETNVFEVYGSKIPEFIPAMDIIPLNIYKLGGSLCMTPCLVLKNMKLISTSNENMSWRISKPISTVIIPCPEIVRFYFGTSSTLIRKLIHGAATNVSELVVLTDSNGKRITGPMPDGRFFITLRKQISDSDAPVIARILSDPIAAAMAQQLYFSLACESLSRRSLYMKAGLPFSGTSELKCQGTWIKIGPKKFVYLVLQITSCSADFPYRGLVLDRENSNRVINHSGRIPVDYPIKQEAPQNDGQIITGINREPSTEIVQTNYQVQDERFLSLKNKTIQFRYKEDAKYKSASKKISCAEITGYETGQGDPRNTTLAPLEIQVTNSGDTQEGEIVSADMMTLWQSLKILSRIYKCRANVIVVETGERTLEYKLSHFPMKSRWSMQRGKSGRRGRQALWIEIEKQGYWYYIVEWEGRKAEFGIYLLKLSNGKCASNEELQLVMLEWAINKDNKARRSDGLERGWTRESIQHPRAKKIDVLPWMMAERIGKRLK